MGQNVHLLTQKEEARADQKFKSRLPHACKRDSGKSNCLQLLKFEQKWASVVLIRDWPWCIRECGGCD